MERHYFIARGKSLEILENYWNARKAHLMAAYDLSESLGLERTVCYDRISGEFLGFLVPKDGEMPAGLRKHPRHPCWVPNRKNKIGSELHKKVRALPSIPDRWNLNRQLCGVLNWISPEGGVYSISAEYLGDELILAVPDLGEVDADAHGQRWTPPPDAEPIPRSVYWQKREAHEAAEAAKKAQGAACTT